MFVTKKQQPFASTRFSPHLLFMFIRKPLTNLTRVSSGTYLYFLNNTTYHQQTLSSNSVSVSILCPFPPLQCMCCSVSHVRLLRLFGQRNPSPFTFKDFTIVFLSLCLAFSIFPLLDHFHQYVFLLLLLYDKPIRKLSEIKQLLYQTQMF